MENYSYQLLMEWQQQEPLVVISWGGSQIWLLAFVLWAFLRSVVILKRIRIRYIHVGDPVLSGLGLVLKWWAKLPVFTTAHGLDVTYNNPIYQGMIRFCLPRLDGVICISNHTRGVCLTLGVSAKRCQTIFPGTLIASEITSRIEARQLLTEWSGLELADRPIILSVGRLIERKGFGWFIQNVMPRLVSVYPNALYLVCGTGPLHNTILRAVGKLALGNNVMLLGKVTPSILDTLYAAADLFVMPNIMLPNEPEGFGLVTLEARATGLPVVATHLDGIHESISSGEDGLLIPPEDPERFYYAVHRLLQDPNSILTRAQIRERIKTFASWPIVVGKYRATLENWVTA